MIISNISIDQLNKALELTNKEFDNNAIYNRFQQLSKSRFRVTLKVKDLHKPGSRLGFSLTSKGNHRHIPSACWHLYGRFIDIIFELEPKARVQANGNVFYSYNWEWIDRNIGSMMNPFYYSEACECGL